MSELPPTPEQAEWLARHKVIRSEILKSAASNPKRCATCIHFYRHDYSPQRYTYCKLRTQKGTSYGHAKTKPTNTCDQWKAKEGGAL